MKLSSSGRKPHYRWRELACFPREDRGVAAVEFALILPILVAVYLGLNQVQVGYSIKQKLNSATRAVADLSTREASFDSDGLAKVFAAAGAIMRPYTYPDTQIVISSITVTANGDNVTGKVAWSCKSGASSGGDRLDKKTKEDPYTVPEGFKNLDSAGKPVMKSFIVVETRYPYTPTIGEAITGTIQLNDRLEWPVRDADKVDYKSTSTTMDCSV